MSAFITFRLNFTSGRTLWSTKRIASVVIMNDIMERVMRPFLIVIFVIGNGIYRHSNGHPKLCLSIFYIVIMWSVYTLVHYKLLLILLSSPQSLFGFLTYFSIGLQLFLSMLSMVNTFDKHKVQFFFRNGTIQLYVVISRELKVFCLSKEFLIYLVVS